VEDIDLIQLGVAKPGESAKGIVILEKKGELYLDSTPCEVEWNRKQIFTFNKPYSKEEMDDQACTGTNDLLKISKITRRKR
jgi:hypothetical protein